LVFFEITNKVLEILSSENMDGFAQSKDEDEDEDEIQNESASASEREREMEN